MKKKILIAIDDSENAMRAAEFVSTTFTPDHEVTLFSVIPDTMAICDMNSPELVPYFQAQQESFCLLEDQKRKLMSNSIEKAKNLLMGAGFEAKAISVMANPKKQGIARDIVEEARKGYTTIVMGRRGLSGIKEFLMGSVSQKVLHLTKNASVLLVN
jgi:nucleotide-binding universal stress UspA family protein